MKNVNRARLAPCTPGACVKLIGLVLLSRALAPGPGTAPSRQHVQSRRRRREAHWVGKKCWNQSVGQSCQAMASAVTAVTPSGDPAVRVAGPAVRVAEDVPAPVSISRITYSAARSVRALLAAQAPLLTELLGEQPPRPRGKPGPGWVSFTREVSRRRTGSASMARATRPRRSFDDSAPAPPDTSRP